MVLSYFVKLDSCASNTLRRRPSTNRMSTPCQLSVLLQFFWRKWRLLPPFASSERLVKIFDVCLSVHRRNKGRKTQLDATQCFIELVICSTCFGHIYAHHRGLAAILLVWHVACNSWLLVVGKFRCKTTGQQPCCPAPDLLITGQVPY